MKVLSYGAGTNSVAILVGFKARGIVPDIILFADTGGERPETYAHIKIMQDWCADNGFPEISITREKETLEADCLRRNALPGLAYGFKSCSEHFKIRPQKRWLKDKGIKADFFYVGIDADETHRVRDDSSTRYPLIEWGWGRKECIEAIKQAGLPLPGKSSCFFCPSMRQAEIRELNAKHPELMDRALKLEKNANLTSVRGLGRSFSWESLIATDDLFPELYNDIPCGCYDGGTQGAV